MSIELRGVTCAPLDDLAVSAPDGAIIGVVGEDGAGTEVLLCVAGGAEPPQSGEVVAAEPRRVIGPFDPLNLAPARVLCLAYALDQHDALVRRRAMIGLERLRRAGSTILVASHDRTLLAELCDEIWWLDGGKLAAKGDPREVLDQYEHHVAQRFAEWGAAMAQAAVMSPSLRRGDGRARLQSVETLDADGRPTLVWRSGETVSIDVTVRFEQAVENPVVGIMIRTRIGFEVYGTNTELEGVQLGPCTAGETLHVRFTFACQLCPQEYTLTAASHDPDGVWHDWVEDAVAFSVADSRYTAGVANLRAAVTLG